MYTPCPGNISVNQSCRARLTPEIYTLPGHGILTDEVSSVVDEVPEDIQALMKLGRTRYSDEANVALGFASAEVVASNQTVEDEVDRQTICLSMSTESVALFLQTATVSYSFESLSFLGLADTISLVGKKSRSIEKYLLAFKTTHHRQEDPVGDRSRL